MNRSELKKILKPLIEECIREAIFEEGVLSGIILEVVKGTASAPVQQLTENKKIEADTSYIKKSSSDYREKIRETKKKMLDAIGKESYNGVNLFEGTDPLSRSGQSGAREVSSPLDSYAPSDSGVDISGLFSSRWKNLV